MLTVHLSRRQLDHIRSPAMTFATKSAIGAVVSLVAISSSIAADNQPLRRYQWIETTEVTWKGEAQPPSRQLCRYGPDGQVQKTPIGPIPEPRRETGEIEGYTRETSALIGAYL